MTENPPPHAGSDGVDPLTERRFWINTVTLDHVRAASEGGFTQADHGVRTRLGRPRPGDDMIFYSPRTSLQEKTPVQQFTAWATITGDAPYQVVINDDFQPWRLAATFHTSSPVDIRPLIHQLSFIPDASHWGFPFRRGLFTIPADDFAAIQTRMTA